MSPAAPATPLLDLVLAAQFETRPEVAEALLALMGRVLEGRPEDEVVPLWLVGPGGEGKTTLVRLLEAIAEVDGAPAPRVAHERADAAAMRARAPGAPVLATDNHLPPVCRADQGRLAMVRFTGGRPVEPMPELLDRIVATELPAVRARLLAASAALRARGDDVWAALPIEVVV